MPVTESLEIFCKIHTQMLKCSIELIPTVKWKSCLISKSKEILKEEEKNVNKKMEKRNGEMKVEKQ